jgi:hypothetical protein
LVDYFVAGITIRVYQTKMAGLFRCAGQAFRRAEHFVMLLWAAK